MVRRRERSFSASREGDRRDRSRGRAGRKRAAAAAGSRGTKRLSFVERRVDRPFGERVETEQDVSGEVTYLEAIRLALLEEMREDPRVFLLGQDIGHFGGAF